MLIMNMGTRHFVPLGSSWKSTLSGVCTALGSALWLNLLCCTKLDGTALAQAGVDPKLTVKDWSQLIK